MNISNDSFPNAPQDWSVDMAMSLAAEDGISMSDDHWNLLNALQEYYKKVEQPKLRQVKDALDERFHAQGGIKYLHQILPQGPVAEGCKLAGLHIPAGALDKSFGSVA